MKEEGGGRGLGLARRLDSSILPGGVDLPQEASKSGNGGTSAGAAAGWHQFILIN